LLQPGIIIRDDWEISHSDFSSLWDNGFNQKIDYFEKTYPKDPFIKYLAGHERICNDATSVFLEEQNYKQDPNETLRKGIIFGGPSRFRLSSFKGSLEFNVNTDLSSLTGDDDGDSEDKEEKNIILPSLTVIIGKDLRVTIDDTNKSSLIYSSCDYGLYLFPSLHNLLIL
jgi:hypothetical protein